MHICNNALPPSSSGKSNGSEEVERQPLLGRDIPSDVASTSGSVSSSSSLLRFALFGALGLTAVVLVTSGSIGDLAQTIQDAVSESGVLGPVIFILAYAAATVLLFPASILTLAAGALFGPLQGTAIVSVASTLGATLAFLVSRYLARPFVEDKLRTSYPKLQSVVEAVSAQGLRLVLLLRLSPLFPFNLLNYALGLTTVPLWEYVAASWAGMLPGTFAYVFLGGAGKAAADAGAGSLPPEKLALYGVGVVATIAVTKLISSAASKALQEGQAGSDQDGR